MTEQTFYSILPRSPKPENLHITLSTGVHELEPAIVPALAGDARRALRPGRENGLVYDRISPRTSKNSRYAKCDVMPGGVVLKRHNLSPNAPPTCGRGSIFGFSTGSKRRVMHKLMRLDWTLLLVPVSLLTYGAFITLTYPDVFPNDWEVWKRDLDTIIKRICRYYPGVAGMWKLELKKRKSGEVNKGKLAPHFHFLLYFQNGLKLGDFRPWLSQAWYEVVGSNDLRHLGAGTQAKTLYGTVSKIMNYCGKYLGKDFEVDFETGRCWGEFGSMPIGETYTYTIDLVEFCRRLRCWGKDSKYLRSRKSPSGMSVFNPAVVQLTIGLRVDGIPPPDKLYKTLCTKPMLEGQKRRLARIAPKRRKGQTVVIRLNDDWEREVREYPVCSLCGLRHEPSLDEPVDVISNTISSAVAVSMAASAFTVSFLE